MPSSYRERKARESWGLTFPLFTCTAVLVQLVQTERLQKALNKAGMYSIYGVVMVMVGV